MGGKAKRGEYGVYLIAPFIGLLFFAFYFGPSFTGLQVAEDVSVVNLSKNITESTSFFLNQSGMASSVEVTGEVIGSGNVTIILKEDKDYLIYTNIDSQKPLAVSTAYMVSGLDNGTNTSDNETTTDQNSANITSNETSLYNSTNTSQLNATDDFINNSQNVSKGANITNTTTPPNTSTTHMQQNASLNTSSNVSTNKTSLKQDLQQNTSLNSSQQDVSNKSINASDLQNASVNSSSNVNTNETSITQDLQQNASLNASQDNISNSSKQPKPTTEFENICYETCSLDGVNISEAEIVVNIQGNASVFISEIKLGSKQQKPAQVQNITDFSIKEGSNHSLELNNYFAGAENYTIQGASENISYATENGTITFKAEGDYQGNWSITAKNSQGKTESNTFSINVTSPETNINMSNVVGEVEAGKPVRIRRKAKGKIPEKAFNVGKQKMQAAVAGSEDTVEFSIPGPDKKEKKVAKGRKKVTVSSKYHFKNVTASTNVNDVPREAIKIYWLKNNSKKKIKEINYLDENNNGLVDKVEWIVPHLSSQTFEVVIDVLNVQSYPTVGGNWTVKFNTTGQANLTISAVNDTSYGNETPADLNWLELKCGEKQVNASFNGTHVFYENWNCSSIGYHTVKVLTSGKHHQKFQFFNETAYAHNYAENTTVNASLAVWDSTDPEGGGLTKYVNDSVNFYANYTNSTNHTISDTDGGDCDIAFNKTGAWQYSDMSFNSSSEIWEYNTSFDSYGNFDWKVNCSHAEYGPISSKDNITIRDQPLCSDGSWHLSYDYKLYTSINCNQINITNNAKLSVYNESVKITADEMNIIDGVLTHRANGGSRQYALNLSVGNLTIDTGGIINVSGKGYRGGGSETDGNGPGGGYGNWYGGSGAGFGGIGGDASSVSGGSSYGSLRAPVALGSGGGGGDGCSGGSGGGAIYLKIVDTVSLEGNIISKGVDGNYCEDGGGGGSGGSIHIITSNITGTGNISATAGDGGGGSSYNGGGGAGGRIALYYHAWNFTGKLIAEGGNGYQKGENGTIFGLPSPPLVNITSPTNTYYDSSVWFNVTAYDENYIDSCWYNLLGSNTSMNGSGNKYYYKNNSVTDGNHTATFYCNDTWGEVNSENVSFIVDTTPPSVSIHSPKNITYNTSNLLFNVTTNDNTETDDCWYNIDGGTNITLSNNTYYDYNSVSNGQHTANFFCNDILGNLNDSQTVSFKVEEPKLSIDTIYPAVSEINITQLDIFNVTFNISCWVNDCGDVNVSLKSSVLNGPAISQIYDSSLGQDGNGNTISSSFDSRTFLDNETYTHDSNKLYFNSSGWYKISYSASWHSTSADDRHVMKNWIRKNGTTTIIPSETRCYIRNTGYGDMCTNEAFLLFNASKGDYIELIGTKDHGASGDTVTVDDVYMSAVEVDSPVAQAWDTTGGQDYDSSTITVNLDSKTKTDSIYSFSSENITVTEDGMYKVYYTVNSHDTGQGDRQTVQAWLRKNANTVIKPSKTFAYIRNNGDGDQNHISGVSVVQLNAGDSLEIRQNKREQESGGTSVTLADNNWLLMEKIDNTDLASLRESAGEQQVSEGSTGAIEFDTPDVLGDSFTHSTNEPSRIYINKDGFYEVSYVFGFYDDQSSGRYRTTTWLRKNGNTLIQPSKTRSYTRGYSYGYHETATAHLLMNLSKGDYLELLTNPVTGSGGWIKTIGNATSLTISPISPPKTIIPTDSATPFYTNKSSNPYTINLSQGENQEVTYWVNASGEINTTRDLQGYAEAIQGYQVSNKSESFNVTIREDTTAPAVSLINPANNTYAISQVDINATVMDVSPIDSVVAEIDNSTNITLTSAGNDVYFNTSYTFADGTHTVRIYANDTKRNLNNSEAVSFTIDTTPPTVSVSSPQNITYNYSDIWFNVTASDTLSNVKSCWYNFNGSNLSMNNSGNNWFSQNMVADGSYTAGFYCNDSAGNLGSDNISFKVDTTSPAVNIFSPDNSSYNHSHLDINASVTDNFAVDSVIAEIDESTNITLTSSGNDLYTNTSYTFADGAHTVRIYANDTENNLNASETVSFKVDTVPPSLSIESPENTTYNYSDIWFNLTSVDTFSSVASCWYNLNGSNISMSQSGNNWYDIVNTSRGEPLTANFYCNDTHGHVNSTNVSFFVLKKSNLTIWSSSSSPYVGDTVTFYANYSNGTSMNASCDVNISSWHNMSYNNLHKYSRSFSSSGTKTYTINCSHPSYVDKQLTRTLSVNTQSSGGGDDDECDTDSDCPDGYECDYGDCVEIPETCDDGIQNQGEEGVDCGGPCEPCPSCDDGIQNQNETGVDCGGPCIDCQTCDDGIKNQGEEGIDCGGPCEPCPSCDDGIQNQGEEGVDCGGPCEPCSKPSCSDGIQNQNETGIDCGGPCEPCGEPSCSDGKQNQNETGIDCGGPCEPCGEPSCSDGIQNQNETGIDCGGPCKPCGEPSCSDGKQNQNETGIDCGGPCKPCPENKTIDRPGDVSVGNESGYSQTEGSGLATCTDGHKNCHTRNGGYICEKGIDCGGPCSPCSTCNDGKQNCHNMGGGLVSCEQDIDCGGPCGPCGGLNFDNTNRNFSVGEKTSCSDGVRNCRKYDNGTVNCEKMVDCGGPCKPCDIRDKSKDIAVDTAKVVFSWQVILVIIGLIIVKLLVREGTVKAGKELFKRFRK